MIEDNDFVISGAGLRIGNVSPGAHANDDFPELSFEEAVRRFRYWKYMPAAERRTLTFHQHAWRREYLRRIRALERRLRTEF